jgi:hypothetical protein
MENKELQEQLKQFMELNTPNRSVASDKQQQQLLLQMASETVGQTVGQTVGASQASFTVQPNDDPLPENVKTTGTIIIGGKRYSVVYTKEYSRR